MQLLSYEMYMIEKWRLMVFEDKVKGKVNLSLCLTKHHAKMDVWRGG